MIHSVKTKLFAICLTVIWLSNGLLFLGLGARDWWLFFIVQLLFSVLSVALVSYFFTPLAANFTALEAGLLNFKDNEFSSSLRVHGNDELSQLCLLYNEVAEKLRKEKQHIYQRELLLDKVIESSPIVMFLVDDDDYFVYSNSATRHFLNQGKQLAGEKFSLLMQQWPDSLQQAITQHQDGLFTIEQDAETDTWHLSRGDFLLNNKKHRLFLLKQMTRELNRQEVAVWKKVIRVISHELNNSLAPISSVTHSGKLIADRIAHEKLTLIFETIRERIEHLNHFILGYARFAKLPSPLIAPVNLVDFIDKLQAQLPFTLVGAVPPIMLNVDASQIEQVLINVLKNAQESGSKPADITLTISAQGHKLEIAVKDRGTGMSEQVLKNALIPFYSTKQSGTGLGLALCREIIEAHNGQLALHNRTDGGLAVLMQLPITMSVT